MSTLTLAAERRAAIAERLGLLPPCAPVKPPQAQPQGNKKARRRAEAMAVHTELAAAFPDVIAAWGYGPRVALNVGIHKDIRALLPERKPTAIATFLHFYTINPGYRRLLKPGSHRVDLDGKECGIITEAVAQPAKRSGGHG